VIPGTPIAYWISPNFEKIFTEGIKITEFVSTKDGLTTGNNEKFIKYFWEVSLKNIEFNCDNAERFWNSGKKYAPLIKGGKYRKWYGNNWFVITYDEASYKRLSQCGNKLPSRDIYFLPYVSWNRISTRMAFRYSENGYLFESASLIAHSMQKNNLMYFLAFSNSVLAKNEMAMINPTTNMLSGYVDELCIPENPYRSKCEELASLCVEISKEDWDTFETSWDFKRHALVNGQTLKASFNNWSSTCDDRFNKIKSSEEELNRIFIEISSLKKELNPEIEDNEITVSKADLGRDIRSFISYAVGCMFGRYNIDIEGLVYAGGEWDSSKYSSYIPDKDNILPITDEEYFYDDIVGLFVAFVSKVFGVASLEENLEFIANALDKTGVNPREIIRNYFVKDFYKDHCQIYQKRPIYWLFDSGKQNGFKALIYMHRYDENTIGNLRIDYLHRIQQIYENEIGRMQDTIENSKDAREVITATKRKEKLIKQLQETKEYDEKIAHLALARTSIDLDDGVKVNYEKVQTDRDGKKLDVLAKI